MKLYLFEPEPNVSTRLCARPELELVGCADSIHTAPYVFPEHDLMLVSAVFPTSDILQFLTERPRVAGRTVIVEIRERPADILPLLEAGAAGYVRHGASAAEMIATLGEIQAGKPPLAPPIGEALLNRMHELLAMQTRRNTESITADCAALKTLTGRERQVLALIRNGASNQEIAKELMIELGTVKNHVHNILKKLNVTRREQAAQYLNLLEQIT